MHQIDPIHPVWAVLSLLLPAFSTWLLSRRMRFWNDGIARTLTAVTVFVILHLLPIHLLGALELARVIASVTLFKIALAEGFVFVLVLLYVVFRSPIPEGIGRRSQRAIAAAAYLHSLQSFVLIGGALVATCYGVFLVNLLVSYPTGTDAVSYHFPIAVRWLQEGSLRIPSSKEWHFGLPGNAEVPMMVLLGTGWQILATLPQMLAVVVLSLGTYRITARLGASPSAAAAVVLILLNVPLITFQTFSGYVDLFGASFIVAAVSLFLGRYDGPPPQMLLSRLAICGLACGIALGTKPTFYVYAAVFWVATVCVLFAERARHRIPVKTVAAALLVVILVPGAFWFGRAIVATGNPLYPIKVEVLGHTVFDGYARTRITTADEDRRWVRSRGEWLIYPWTEWKDSGFSYGTGTGLGAAFAAFVPLGMLGAVAGLLLRRRDEPGLQRIFTAAVLLMGIVWWFTLARMLRFAIPLIACACALTAPLLDYVVRHRQAAVGSLLVLSLATTSIIAAFQPAHSFVSRARIWDWTRAVYYGVPAIVDDFPRGSCVLNLADFTINFALAGKHLSNRVITSFERPRRLTEEFIRARGVDYVVKTGARDEDDRVISAMGSRLVFEDSSVLLGGGLDNPWRIWGILQPPDSTKSTALGRRGCFE